MSNQRNETVPVLILGLKLKNRRVSGGWMRDGSITWKFTRLLDGRLIHVQRIRITMEALHAMTKIALKLESEIKRMKAQECLAR